MYHRIIIAILQLALLAGCSSMATQRLGNSVVSGMLNQDDPVTVRTAIPAYLVLLDGLIKDDPQNPELLISGSQLYGAFAASLVDEPERSKKLYEHAKAYAQQALCLEAAQYCEAETLPFAEFTALLDKEGNTRLKVLYAYATSYANWINANKQDWNALLLLPKIEAILQRIIDIEPGHAKGRGQLYLAVMRSQLPASMGGRPETGRKHFELALDYSKGRDLMAKVEYARNYARLVFNQALHDQLLNEVINADPVEPDLTLSNVLAQQKAIGLLNDNYF